MTNDLIEKDSSIEMKVRKSPIIVPPKAKKLYSEAWPNEYRNRIDLVSENHTIVEQLLRKLGDTDEQRQKGLDDIMYFRELMREDLLDIKMLHKEWFPLNYP